MIVRYNYLKKWGLCVKKILETKLKIKISKKIFRNKISMSKIYNTILSKYIFIYNKPF